MGLQENFRLGWSPWTKGSWTTHPGQEEAVGQWATEQTQETCISHRQNPRDCLTRLVLRLREGGMGYPLRALAGNDKADKQTDNSQIREDQDLTPPDPGSGSGGITGEPIVPRHLGLVTLHQRAELTVTKLWAGRLGNTLDRSPDFKAKYQELSWKMETPEHTYGGRLHPGTSRAKRGDWLSTGPAEDGTGLSPPTTPLYRPHRQDNSTVSRLTRT